MGYYTHVYGEITLDPPIPWGEIQESPFLPDSNDWRDIRFDVASETRETDEGTLTRKHARAIVPASEDSYKAYNIEEHLGELVSSHGEGRFFPGELVGEGEEQGDMWKLRIVNSKVERKSHPKSLGPSSDRTTR